MSHKYGIFSWWWAHSCPKHVEKSNKHIKKIYAPSWLYLQDYTGMHGQQYTKFYKNFESADTNLLVLKLQLRRDFVILTFQCRSQWPRGLRRRSVAARLLKLWVRTPPGHGCLSVVIVVCCQIQNSATSWSLIQRSPTDCSVRRCVWSRNLVNEEALSHVGGGLLRQKK